MIDIPNFDEYVICSLLLLPGSLVGRVVVFVTVPNNTPAIILVITNPIITNRVIIIAVEHVTE